MGRTSDAKERLIHSGMDLLKEGGYAMAGVQEICMRAGVRKGSFYHFFPTKSHLGLAVVARFQSVVTALLDQALAPDLPPEGRIERLFVMVAEIQERFRQDEGMVMGCPIGNLVLEMSTRDEALRRALERVLDDIMMRLESTLPSENAREKAEAIFAMLEGALLIAKASNDPAIVRRLAQTAKQLATIGVQGPLVPGGIQGQSPWDLEKY
ncbi:MAG: TetR/AcrR family transcriptional regulator [Magnetococcales bacterium]|nr:TetR/AcrR family transcriptional regulator [Magnetococcales bacterium]